MDEAFWKGRWERGETGWHQTEVEPRLMQWLGDLEPGLVLVPLCGKSLDLAWLAKQGHTVLGIELSTMACEVFFRENAITYERLTDEHGNVSYRGGGITILNMNVFAVTAAQLPGFVGAVYDRAALIALPAEMRRRYVDHLVGLLRARGTPRTRFLQILLERTPTDDKGPPFSVSAAELEQLYRATHVVRPLSRERLEWPDAEGFVVDECVYALEARARSSQA
jgi:thiopurine S-methyltransferase